MDDLFESPDFKRQLSENVGRAQALAQSRRAGLSYEDIIRAIVAGLPGQAVAVGEDIISAIGYALKEDYLKMEGLSFMAGNIMPPLPEKGSLPADMTFLIEKDRVSYQIGPAERALFCDLSLMAELFAGLVFTTIAVLRARAGRVTPWMDIVFFVCLCLAAFAMMFIQGIRNLVCDVTPPVIEWKRGELPHFADTRGGGWAE